MAVSTARQVVIEQRARRRVKPTHHHIAHSAGGQPARLIGNAAVCRGRDLEIPENQVDKALARRQLARVLGEKKELGLDERLM
jgi:hypothetical protein